MRGKTSSAPHLNVVPAAPDRAVMPPLRPLGTAGRRLWDSVMQGYCIEDAGGLEILMQACAAADRAEELAAAIARDGAIVQTRSGPKEHPGLRHELQNRAFVVRSLQRLGLDVEPVRPIGRPPGLA